MKVPFSANNHNSSSKPSPTNCTTTTNVNTAALPSAATNSSSSSSPYEPKSVLELRGSPSPVSEKPSSNYISAADFSGGDHPIELEDHVLNIDHPQLEDWDSLMRDLGLHDDFNPVSKPFSSSAQSDTHQITPTNIQYSDLAEFPPVSSFESTQFASAADFGLLPDIPIYSAAPPSSFEALSGDLNNSSSGGGNNWNTGFDYVDELIRLAECFETNSLQLGQVILARLNHRLRSPTGKPIQRASFYFKEALQSLLTGSTRPSHHPASSSEIIQTIKAHKTFSSVSPIPMFASFTANQAVLEALDASTHIHVIDFDIGIGGQWAPFMKELADKAAAEPPRRAAPPPLLRISALVPEEYAAESRLIRENLSAFARELNIRFEVEFVPIRTFQYLSFKAIKFVDGEKVAVILSPAIFRQVGMEFLSDLRRISPHVVVHVDVEGQMGFGATPSYRQTVIDGLEFYSPLLESLEAANFNGGGSGGGGEWMRRIETFVLYPKILEGVEASGRQGTPWREAMVAAGLRQVALSQFTEFQAECLLRRVQVRGFHVYKRQAEMLLCWHERPLVATSAWRY